jgi:hypothetical protein
LGICEDAESDGDAGRCRSNYSWEANPALGDRPVALSDSLKFLQSAVSDETAPLTEGVNMLIEDIVATIESTSSPDLENLESRIEARLRGRVRELRLIFHESGIVLRGVTRTYHAMQIAQHVIMAETTVPIFANEIEVR